jgi:hypothetical protein
LEGELMANDVEVEEAEKYFGGTKRQNLDLSFFGRVWLSNSGFLYSEISILFDACRPH